MDIKDLEKKASEIVDASNDQGKVNSILDVIKKESRWDVFNRDVGTIWRMIRENEKGNSQYESLQAIRKYLVPHQFEPIKPESDYQT